MAALSPADRIAFEMYEASARAYLATNRQRRYGRSGQRRYLGMSQVGQPCSRRLWYDFRSFTPKPFDGRLGLIFNDGNHYEATVIEHLRLAGYRIDHAGSENQLEFSDFNGLFKGHCDGIIHGVTQLPHILEIKTANKKRFEAFQQFGVRKTSPVYYCQVQCYMGYAELERALFVIYCKDRSEIYTERIPFVRDDLEGLRNRARSIITANEVPGRSFDSETAFECRYCDFRLHCWTDEGMIMTDDRVCGTCWYLSWNGLRTWCLHPEHPFEIQTWGIGCDDWSYLFDKEFGTHKLNRKPKVSWESKS